MLEEKGKQQHQPDAAKMMEALDVLLCVLAQVTYDNEGGGSVQPARYVSAEYLQQLWRDVTGHNEALWAD